MRLHVGTSGYSYKEWREVFYPKELKPAQWLGYYATQLSAVEINNTFYRMPKDDVLKTWAAEVPEDFRFVIKGSRSITHLRRLKESALESLGFLADYLPSLGDRLGCVLLQLPPNFRAEVERFTAFTKGMPEGFRFAFEFRNPSWFDETIYAPMRKAGAALCVSDSDDRPASQPIVSTADWGYLRLRREQYSDADLARWVDAVRSTGWKEAFVFFKHEDQGAAPALAKRFRSIYEST